MSLKILQIEKGQVRERVESLAFKLKNHNPN